LQLVLQLPAQTTCKRVWGQVHKPHVFFEISGNTPLSFIKHSFKFQRTPSLMSRRRHPPASLPTKSGGIKTITEPYSKWPHKENYDPIIRIACLVCIYIYKYLVKWLNQYGAEYQMILR
jgi:hypothetical protein